MIAKLFCIMGFHSIYKVTENFKFNSYFACRRCGWEMKVHR